MPHLSLADHARRYKVRGPRVGIYAAGLFQPLVILAVVSGQVNHVTLEAQHDAAGSVADPEGPLRDRVEDRLGVGRRRGDSAQDLARRRLLLERLGQLAVPRLELVE